MLIQVKRLRKRKKLAGKKLWNLPLLEPIDGEDDDGTLKKDMIVERGMITIHEEDGEVSIRDKLVSSLKGKFELLGPHDFEFVKVTQKKISVLRLDSDTEYNYSALKKAAFAPTISSPFCISPLSL